MKKHIFLSFALIALFFSCTRQELEDDPILSVSDYPVFYASFESSDEPATRTYADPLHRIRWHEGDRVSIFNGNTTNLEYMFEGETGDSTGVFRIVGEGNRSSVRTRSTSYKYAVYPYDEACALSEDGTLTVTFPAEQSYADNSFGPWDNTMISISEDDTLFFRNAGGYLILKLYGDTTQVTSITLKGNKDEPICGKGYVTVSPDGIPSTRMSEEGSPKLTLLCEEPVPLNASAQKYKEFWFVVPPVTFTEGFTIVIEDSEGRRMTKSTDREVTVKRNERFRMTPLNVPALPATQFVKFEDPNFKAYCVANFDTNWDGGIDLEEALEVTYIYLPKTPIVSSLVGVEFFANLARLFCQSQQLSDLDVSRNLNLLLLYCEKNQLTSLDVSHNSSLQYLICSGNQLTDLDVSHNPHLKQLQCANNQLTHLDVSNNPLLQWFICSGNPLLDLDVSHNPELTQLWCSNNQLTTLDLNQNNKLQDLDCGNNQLVNLDVSRMTDLNQLNCSYNQLTSLDVSHISDLGCSHNQLTSLDLGRHTACRFLNCSDNPLTALDISGSICLFDLNCDHTLLTSLDFRNCTVVNFSGRKEKGNDSELTIYIRWPFYEDYYDCYYYHRVYQGVDEVMLSDTDFPEDMEAIDLGLSVNWCNCNLRATCPEQDGAFYAWGEVVPLGDFDPYNENIPINGRYGYRYKNSCCWDTYKWCDWGSEGPDGRPLVTKYCYDPLYGLDGFTDDSLTLEEEDDVAAAAMGDGWRIPTAEEWDELRRNCMWESVEINGTPGVRATSVIPGYTDRSIFFPLVGCIDHDLIRLEWGSNYYWSSSMKAPSSYPEDPDLNPGLAMAFIIDPEYIGFSPIERYFGCSIRPVKAKENQEEEY